MRLDPKSMQELNQAISSLAAASRTTVEEVLPAQMRLLATDLARNTNPMLKKGETPDAAKEKVKARIYEIYVHRGTAIKLLRQKGDRTANAFLNAVNSGNYSQAAAILNRGAIGRGNFSVGRFDGGALHKQQKFTKSVRRKMVVIDYESVETYVKAKQKLVGFAKGGFATAARELGGVRGIPGFATRQNAPGRGHVSKAGDGLSVTLENQVPYLREALNKTGEENALISRKRNVDSVVKAMMSRKMKKIFK